MSYYLYDTNGYLSDGPSICGLRDISVWASQSEERSLIESFLTSGRTRALPRLIDELERDTASGSIETTRIALLEAATRAEGVLILTDGVGDSEFRAASAVQSETDLHKTADTYAKKLEVAFTYAFAKGRKAIREDNLDTADAEAANAVEKALKQVLVKSLIPIVNASGVTATKMLMKQLTGLRTAAKKTKPDVVITMNFNAKSKEAVEWAEEHAAELIKGITKTTRQRVRSAVVKALDSRHEEGGAWKQLFNDVLDAVGDKDRAQMISHTELMQAAHSGQRIAWEQAAEKGLLTGVSERYWIDTEGSCVICGDLAGTTAPLDGEYEGGIEQPPAHPRCRCTESLKIGAVGE